MREMGDVKKHERLHLFGRTVGELQNFSQQGVSDASVKYIRSFLSRSGESAEDVLSFFNAYEKILTINGVNHSLWRNYLPSLLSTKANKVYSKISIEDCKSYDAFKLEVLKSYGYEFVSRSEPK